MNRLIVPERSNLRSTAVTCSVIQVCFGLFVVFCVGLMLMVTLGSAESGSVKGAIGFMMIASLMTVALDAYIVYGVFVSHRTLLHLACGWMIYPAVTLMSRLSVALIEYADDEPLIEEIIADIDVLSLASNIVMLLVCFAVGLVLYNYHKGSLADKRIVIWLCVGGYALSNISFFIQIISFFSDVRSLVIAVVIAVAMLASLGFGIVNYGRVAFLALSMKTTEE